MRARFFPTVPRTVGKIHPFRSALRIRVSIIAMIDRGLCPLDTYKPLKRLDLNFLASLFGRFFHSRGSFGGFQAPQRALENTGRSDR